METIFDPEHKMTEEEWEAICGITEEKWTRDITDADSNYAALYDLYFHRGKEKKAREYLNQIKDSKVKRELTYVDIIE